MKLQLKLLAPIIIFSLVATGFGVWSFNDAVTTNRQVPIGLEEIPIESEGYYKVDEYEPYNLKSLVDGNWQNTPKLKGDQKILIVPVQLQGTSWTTPMLNRLNTAFFGASEETSWESVSSYYYKSSYGQLNLIGAITDVLNISYTPEQLVSNYVTAERKQGHVAYVAKQFYAKASSELLKEYDEDGNGYVDAVYFMYANDYDITNYWAWVHWLINYDGYNTFQPYKPKPQINTYMWASYKMLEQGYGSSGIDAHMLIHETGHILGLADYYDYDGNSAPMGSVDMMDLNIIDHNPYSKAALEWVKPYYVDGTKDITTITINSFTETGDFILVNDSWNGHALDEYLTIELYTPTGLNKKDSDAPYPYRGLQAFTEPGMRIIHVDSRAYNFTADPAVYTDTPKAKQSIVAASNTKSRSKSSNTDFKLTHMIQAGGVDTFSTTYRATATNADLFHQGDTFEASNAFFVKGKNFNEGNKVGYRIKVESLTATQATISFTKI